MELLLLLLALALQGLPGADVWAVDAEQVHGKLGVPVIGHLIVLQLPLPMPRFLQQYPQHTH